MLGARQSNKKLTTAASWVLWRSDKLSVRSQLQLSPARDFSHKNSSLDAETFLRSIFLRTISETGKKYHVVNAYNGSYIVRKY